jgi:hypothetical protein
LENHSITITSFEAFVNERGCESNFQAFLNVEKRSQI